MNASSPVVDASGLLILLYDFGERAVDFLQECTTSSLIYYEIGNAIWKECFLVGRFSSSEAFRLLSLAFKILNIMHIVHINEELGTIALKLAGKLKITYYDAVYLAIAQNLNSVLVTEDKKLAKAAEGASVKVMNVKQFISQKFLC